MDPSPLYVDRVPALISTISAPGTSVFMVEQNASLGLKIPHHGYVLRSDRSGAPAADPLRDAAIRNAYLGSEGDAA